MVSNQSIEDVRLRPFSLRFFEKQADLETVYANYYFNKNLTHFRYCHYISVLFYLMAGVIDYSLFPSLYLKFWGIRFGIVAPCFMIGLMITYRPIYRYIWRQLSFFYILSKGKVLAANPAMLDIFKAENEQTLLSRPVIDYFNTPADMDTLREQLRNKQRIINTEVQLIRTDGASFWGLINVVRVQVVHGIIESYGGKIFVESEPGSGTHFTVHLPTAQNQDGVVSYRSDSLPTGSERILIVDDETTIANVGSLTLRRLGYQVETRTDSLEALDLFRTRPNDFDLVITDMTMPHMTGDRLAAELINLRPDIPIILCTGYSKRISKDDIAAIGIKAFTLKPFARADLANTVRRVLDEAQSTAGKPSQQTASSQIQSQSIKA